MNRKDVAALRRQLKLDNDLLSITHIYNVFIKQESSDIYHEECQAFALLDREQQELFLANFKKVLGGRLGEKLFEIRFQRSAVDQPNETQQRLYEGLQTGDLGEWKAILRELALKMVQDVQYDKDIVITYIRGDYRKPTKRHSQETEIHEFDEVYRTPFMLCSLNQTEQPKRSLIFDFIEKEFKLNWMADPVINLTSPLGGFLFPCFTDNAADVNHILYAAGKANQPDMRFIESVLGGEQMMTAKEDKAVFEEIVKEVIGDQVNAETLSNVYEEINRLIDEEEEEQETSAMLDTKVVERVLKVSGVEEADTEKVQKAFKKVVDDENYELKASHVLPSFTSKSIKIDTKVAKISISPQDLKYVRQVNLNGKRCILIEVEEDAVIEGFTLLPEELLKEGESR
ncbi:hypothetical protein BEP19_11750 [Ammoniphilus oxalaticus]|uniref:DUF4317 domain-containing protein n=1 Tax=Ammoniphilus oxalaticus TaxID=66863 RepID=A0A419SGJ6_9BACL|nr:DUF4317 domain-containing protein [Ammoniphilus oxalaticus]RKD22903.1 hypothetical protein BEP19_11750 [Ammoniphilus oxalaticus]